MISLYMILLPPNWNAEHIAHIIGVCLPDTGMRATAYTPSGFCVLTILDEGDTTRGLDPDYVYRQLGIAAQDRVDELVAELTYSAEHNPKFDLDTECLKLEQIGLAKL